MSNMQKDFKQKARRPDPRMLGSGLAHNAGEALKNRRSRLEQMEAEALGEVPQPQKPRGLADGGRATPALLGWGMARRAGEALAGRRSQIDGAVEGAGAPVAPRPAPTAGGLSNIRDGAVPPAHMLVAQRRGLADGGMPDRQAEIERKVRAIQRPPQQVLETGASVGSSRARNDYMRMGRPLRPLDVVNNQERAAAGLPSGAQVRAAAGLPATRPNPNMRFYQDGGDVEGPGGPTDDKVGPVMLSDKEYVLPADTVEAVGGPEALDELRDATHEFIDERNRPRGLADGGRAFVGPKDPGWLARQRGMARTERAARSAVDAGEASHAQQVLVDRNNQALDTPEVNNPLGEIPGVGLASRGASTASGAVQRGLSAAAPKVMDATKRGLGWAAEKANQVGLKAGLVKPRAVVETAKPPRAVVEVARPSPKMSGAATKEALKKGAMPTSGRVGANAATQLALGTSGAAASPGQTPTPEVPTTAGATTQPTATQLEDQRVGDALTRAGVSRADQGGAAYSYQQADMLSRQDAGLDAGRMRRLGGDQYSEGNADIYAGSTRADGRLNNFVGIGNRNRPNWEQRNPEAHQEALDRAAADKAKVTQLAVANIDGTADGLDRAWQLAAGDPEATAAVQQAINQRSLRQAALRGNKSAADILRQESADRTSLEVGRMAADADIARANATRDAGLARAMAATRNADRAYSLQERTARRADDKYNRELTMGMLEGTLGKQFDKDGNPNPAFADFFAKLNTTLQGRAGAGGKPLTMGDLEPQELKQLLDQYALKRKTEPSALRRGLEFITGNARPRSDDLEATAPDRNTAGRGWFGIPGYRDNMGYWRASPWDPTLEEQQLMGFDERAE